MVLGSLADLLLGWRCLYVYCEIIVIGKVYDDLQKVSFISGLGCHIQGGSSLTSFSLNSVAAFKKVACYDA